MRKQTNKETNLKQKKNAPLKFIKILVVNLIEKYVDIMKEIVSLISFILFYFENTVYVTVSIYIILDGLRLITDDIA